MTKMMPRFAVKDVDALIHCQIVGDVSAHIITDYQVDSRKCSDGCAFFPLAGEVTDGHFYIAEAFGNGAAVSFVAEPFWKENRNSLLQQTAGYKAGFIIVPDPLVALQELAANYMRQVNPFVIGITGSNGKTTTKELVASGLSKLNRTVYSNQGNLNSEIGLPMAVLRMPPNTEVAVFEMGMDHQGEMQLLADIVRPAIAVVSNIGNAHIGQLGSVENIALEKKKIFSYFNESSVAFLRKNEPFFDLLVADVPGSIVAVEEHFDAVTDLGVNGYRLELDGVEFSVALPGEHNLQNISMAIAVAKYFNISTEDIASSIGAVRPLFGRGQFVEGQYNLLIDCYNANPASMRASLDFISNLDTLGRRKVAVIGSMKDLGQESYAEHRALGEYVAGLNFGLVLFTGEEMKSAYHAFIKLQGEKQGQLFDSVEDLIESGDTLLHEGDTILLKASRSLELERFAKWIQDHTEEDLDA